MLVKLSSAMVVKYWDLVAKHIIRSLPDKLHNRLAVFRKAIVEDRAQVWVFNKDKKIKAIITTAVFHDICFNLKRLNLYTISRVANDPLTPEEYKDGFEILMQFAKDKGCNSIVAYTSNTHVVDVAKDIDWKLEFCIYKLLE